MTGSIIEFFRGITIPPQLSIFIISLLPIMELRVGLIAASIMNVPLGEAILICYVANILPVPLILLFVKHIFTFLRRIKAFDRMITKLEGSAVRRSDSIKRKQYWGLFLFVAIPLPGTGAWTGALIATLLNMDIKKSFATIALGVAGAGAIMLTLTYFIPGLFGLKDIF